MNKKRIELLIDVLSEIPEEEFYLPRIYMAENPYPHKLLFNYGKRPTIDDFKNHTCGTTACALGYLALDERANKLGFKYVTNDGKLHRFQYNGSNNAVAAQLFFSIPYSIAKLLFGYGDSSSFYDKPIEKITPADVVYQLEYLRLTGELHYGHNAG